MHSDNWDDLRFVLAVVEHGSLAAAARALNVNHATVLRRVGAFETRMGAQVFVRTAQGYQVRPDMMQVVEAAREVEQAMARLDHAGAAEQALSGRVRITSTDSICQFLMPGVLADLAVLAPGLRVTLLGTNLHLNMAQLAAEIAVRPTERLADDLTGEVACAMRFDVYTDAAAPGPRPWIALTGSLARSAPATWQEARQRPGEVSAGADSFLIASELAAQGLGQAVLPRFVGDRDARLARVAELGCDLTVPLWVSSHAELADVPRLRGLRTLLAEALAARAGMLDPEA